MELTVCDLVVEYTSGDYVVRPLNQLNLDASDGQLVVLLGASGCGKTTLLSVLGGILRPTSGQVMVGEVDVGALRGSALVAYRRKQVGIVFQSFNLVPSLSATENVRATLRHAGVPAGEAKQRAAALLDVVGLAERADHRPGQLSGGQQQRVAIARALAMDPPLILADEPTAHLDYIQVEGVVTLLRQLASPGRLVIVATHDDRILPLADRVIHLTPHADQSKTEIRTVKLDLGEVLFEQGDASDLVYVVETGLVDIFRRRTDGTEERLRTAKPGEYFGELGPLLRLQRSASARALIDTTLTGYSPEAFRNRYGAQALTPGLDGHPDAGRVALRPGPA
jgi:putative ABC transport system ATP-binding protein